MGRKLTNEEFTTRAEKLHGKKFDYANVDYKTMDSKVTIICPKHGEFRQIAKSHLNGMGCFKCGRDKVAKTQTSSTDEFIKKSREIHGDNYLYGMVDYIKNSTNVKIFCKEHGVFEQTPQNHLVGKGCKKCGTISAASCKLATTEDFVKKSVAVHGNKYNYNNTKYKNAISKVNILCNTCKNIFEIVADKHTQGRGCSFCSRAGFNTPEDAFLYVINYEDITKIGITKVGVEARMKNIVGKSGIPFKKVFSIQGKSSIIYKIEQKILKECRKIYHNIDNKFEGSTECFYDVNLAELLNRITNLQKEYSNDN